MTEPTLTDHETAVLNKLRRRVPLADRDEWTTAHDLHDRGLLDTWNDNHIPPVGFETTPAPAVFPTEHLPPWVAAIVDTVATSLEVPPDLPATMALGVLSAVATLHRTQVAVIGAYHETPNLFLICAMPPGSGKSPAVKTIVKPWVDMADTIAKADIENRREAEQLKRIAEARVKKAEGQAAADPEREAEARLLAYEADQIVVPPARQLIANDVTPESFAQALSDNGGFLTIVSDEGGVIDGISRYTDRGKPPNLDAILQSWSGGDINIRRKSSEPVVVYDPRAVMAITAQPLVVERMMGDGDFVGRGLLDRFLITVPPSYVGYRPRHMAALDAATVAMWAEGVGNIAAALAAHDRPTYHLDPAATELLRQYEKVMERERRPGGLHAPIVGASTKAFASASRLALILHIATGATPAHPISGATMRHAIGIVDFYMAHARALGGSADGTTIAAQTILGWIAGREAGSFTIRELHRAKVAEKHTGPSVTGLLTPLELLVSFGWIAPADEDWVARVGVRGRGGSPVMNRHPLCEHYMARQAATDETEAAIAMVESTLGLRLIDDGNEGKSW